MREGLLALLCAAAVAGCSYDWAVPGGASADAGHEASGIDASMDGANDASATDGGSTDVAAADAPDVVEAATLPACTGAQETTVQQARAAALDCTGVTPDPCMTTVTDECGCPVVVATTNTKEAQYVSAIKSLEATCVPLCATGCGTPPSMGVCIVSDAGSSVLSCFQR